MNLPLGENESVQCTGKRRTNASQQKKQNENQDFIRTKKASVTLTWLDIVTGLCVKEVTWHDVNRTPAQTAPESKQAKRIPQQRSDFSSILFFCLFLLLLFLFIWSFIPAAFLSNAILNES